MWVHRLVSTQVLPSLGGCFHCSVVTKRAQGHGKDLCSTETWKAGLVLGPDTTLGTRVSRMRKARAHANQQSTVLTFSMQNVEHTWSNLSSHLRLFTRLPFLADLWLWQAEPPLPLCSLNFLPHPSPSRGELRRKWVLKNETTCPQKSPRAYTSSQRPRPRAWEGPGPQGEPCDRRSPVALTLPWRGSWFGPAQMFCSTCQLELFPAHSTQGWKSREEERPTTEQG